jgi:hypothetical protein
MEQGKGWENARSGGAGRGRRLVLWSLAGGTVLFLMVGLILPMVSRNICRHYPWEVRTTNCLFEISSIAEALRAYRADYRALPASLEELVPRYLGELPQCPEEPAPRRIGYLYTRPSEGLEGTPLLSCERHWQAGVNVFVTDGFEVRVAWKVPRWRPGEALSSADASAAECERNLEAIGDALHGYQAENGGLPSLLGELVCRYLDALPQCPADFVERRESYLYRPGGPADVDAPLVVCERHWSSGVDLSLDREFRVRRRPKRDVAWARAVGKREAGQVEAERDALVRGSLPYMLYRLNERKSGASPSQHPQPAGTSGRPLEKAPRGERR